MNTRLFSILAAVVLLNSCRTSDSDFGIEKLGQNMPPNTQSPATVGDIQRLMAAPAKPAERYRVNVELIRKGDGPAVAQSLELRPGRAGKLEQVREMTYPTEYELPRVAVKKADQAISPVIPITPTAFETKLLGWWCDLQVVPRGSIVELRGEFIEQLCEGFALNPGELSSPLTDDWKKAVLSENRAVAPRFTRHSSPLAVYAAPGKTYRVDVNSSSRRAWLNISVEPVPAAVTTAGVAGPVTRKARFSRTPEPGSLISYRSSPQ